MVTVKQAAQTSVVSGVIVGILVFAALLYNPEWNPGVVAAISTAVVGYLGMVGVRSPFK